MKLITLNTWGGKAGSANLLTFLKNYSSEVDFFCLQEIWADTYSALEGKPVGGTNFHQEEIMTQGMQEISNTLSEYASYFHPHYMDHYGLQLLVRKSVPILEDGEIFVHKHKGFIPEGDPGNHARNIQYVVTEVNNKKVTIVNFHGLWNGKGKTDTEERIEQSRNIIQFLKGLDGEVVLCGDFNLLPDTESIKLLEDFGLRNLIKEYGITSTRTSLYTKHEKPVLYADYVFVTRGVTVRDFRVLPEEVSDHAALILDFEI